MQEGYAAIFLIFGIVIFVLFLFVGRAITMWMFGTAEIVEQQKEIIGLLNQLAGNAPAQPVQPSQPILPPVVPAQPIMPRSSSDPYRLTKQ